MFLEEFHQAVDAADDLPPGAVADAVALEFLEGPAQDVADVVAAALRGGQRAVGDEHERAARVVEHDLEVLDGLDALLDGRYVGAAERGDVAPGALEVGALVDVELRAERPELAPDLVRDVELQLGVEVCERAREYVGVAGRRAIDKPGHALEPDADVDHLDLELLARAVGERLLLHEDHVAQLEPADEVLHARAQVAAAGPHVLADLDFVLGDLQELGQPAQVELDALLLEEDVLVGQVEDLDAEHHEAGVVAAGEPDVVEVVEAHAELRAAERVRGRVQLARHALRLEAEDAGGYEVHVGPPARHRRLPVDRRHRDARALHRGREVLPGLRLGLLEALGAHVHVPEAAAAVDELVLADAVGVSAHWSALLLWRDGVVHPKVAIALGAKLPFKFHRSQKFCRLEFVRVFSEFWSC